MTFEYCPRCGEKLRPKKCGDEGDVPYCESCKRPFFSFSYPCVICLCITEDGKEIALIKQSYVSENYVNVAGYIKEDETPEEAAVREIKEEIGLEASEPRYCGSWYYPKSGSLMLGFACRVKKGELKLSCEVDSADYFALDKAVTLLRNDSVAQKLLKKYLNGSEAQN